MLQKFLNHHEICKFGGDTDKICKVVFDVAPKPVLLFVHQSSHVALLADQEDLIWASLALENLPYAGAFLEAVPIPALGLYLQPSEFVLSVRVGLVKVPTPTPAPS